MLSNIDEDEKAIKGVVIYVLPGKGQATRFNMMYSSFVTCEKLFIPTYSNTIEHANTKAKVENRYNRPGTGQPPTFPFATVEEYQQLGNAENHTNVISVS